METREAAAGSLLLKDRKGRRVSGFTQAGWRPFSRERGRRRVHPERGRPRRRGPAIGGAAVLLAALLIAPGLVLPSPFTPPPALAAAPAESDRVSRVDLDREPAEGEREGIKLAFEPVDGDRYPNYLRAWSRIAGGPEAMAHLCATVLYGGTVEPEKKMAMGLAIARKERSDYAAAHMTRLLGATESGRQLMRAVHEDEVLSKLSERERLAIRYARELTHEVSGFNDACFRELRGWFQEPEIIELTMVVSFFSYFNRTVEPLNLPIESWASYPAEKRFRADRTDDPRPEARVALLSDGEIRLLADRVRDDAPSSPMTGERIANSMRAMSRVPDMRVAWMELFAVWRDRPVIGEAMQHYISNEVSYVNECHYCKTHQVQKLFNTGVSIDHIARAVDDPGSLPDAERLAVTVAREITLDPTALTDARYAELRKTFGEVGAFEVLQVIARFNFMNRFTSGLGLPAEAVPEVTLRRVEAARRGSGKK